MDSCLRHAASMAGGGSHGNGRAVIGLVMLPSKVVADLQAGGPDHWVVLSSVSRDEHASRWPRQSAKVDGSAVGSALACLP